MLFASKALIYEDLLGFNLGESLHLGDRRLERGSVVGVAVVGFDAYDPIGMAGGHPDDFATEFVALVDFALRNAFHFWGMNTVTLVGILSLLSLNLLGTFDQGL